METFLVSCWNGAAQRTPAGRHIPQHQGEGPRRVPRAGTSAEECGSSAKHETAIEAIERTLASREAESLIARMDRDVNTRLIQGAAWDWKSSIPSSPVTRGV